MKGRGAARRIGIVMNGVTGRMGSNPHLLRSIVAIREQGGAALPGGERLLPEPVLVGRDAAKLEALAGRAGGARWTTNLDEALDDPANEIYFDAQTTDRRAADVRRGIAAGKHIYCEKPSASSLGEALDLYRRARDAGVRHGVVQDKLWLPGPLKLAGLRDAGFFGRILSVRGEFGYWVFEGARGPAPQRPSWNSVAERGGGIIMDMFCHWRYLLDNLFGPVRAVCCLGATHIPERRDESGAPFACTADDAAYAIFQLEGGIVAQFNSSWCARVRRDDLLVMQADGTDGSAAAGLRECWAQSYDETPRAVWNPDQETPADYRAGWTEVPGRPPYGNAFRAQWEAFLRHVAADEPFPWSLLEGAKGVQLGELGLASWKRRAWSDVPELGAE